MVIGDNSFWRVRGFESWCCILDGHDMICCKSYIVCLKRPKINGKEAGVGPFKKSVAVSPADFVGQIMWSLSAESPAAKNDDLESLKKFDF